MGKIIGGAVDFYRLRVTHLNESEGPDLEWRDDILYREPPRQQVSESETWALEAVLIEDDDVVSRIASYESSDAAYAALAAVTEDLEDLTKSTFEERYLSEP